jgi:translocation and assembly module TamB
VFLSSVNKPRGRIEGELTVGGTASAPEFIGEIGIANGGFGIRQTGIEVFDVDVRIAQLQPGQMQLRGSARSGEGSLAIDGITRVSQEAGIRSEVWLRGENFELARLPDWQIAASPSITAILDNHVTTVVGELTIPSARATVREIPETAQKASRDAVVHRQEGGEPNRLRRIDLHLRTVLGDDVQFTGFGLTTGLVGAIQLRGGTHAPLSGQGRLSLVGGRYKAYGQELEIERGNLLFTGPLDDPLLDIRAIRRTTDVVAGIQISGTPSRLQSEVYSEPALSDAEALSYLLTGRPLSTSMDSGEGDTLNQAAFALGLSGAGLITSQVRTQLGLETLTIEGSREESRLVAGKRLGDRLLVEYGYGLVDKLGTLMLRYQLNDRFMLESRSGTVTNLDLLYRARKR